MTTSKLLSRASRPALLAALIAAVGAGCAASGSADGNSPTTGSAGTSASGSAGTSASPPDGSVTGAGTGSAGLGGVMAGAAGTSGAAGTAGSIAGATGAAGIPGVDAGGVDAGFDAGAAGTGATGAAGTGVGPTCFVQLERLLPVDHRVVAPFSGLESGPSSILRVEATVVGYGGNLDWDWTVKLAGTGSLASINFTPVDDTLSVIDIPIEAPGTYEITAKVHVDPDGGMAAAQCQAATQHPIVRAPSAPSFLVRVTPPSGSRLPTREIRITSANVDAAEPFPLDLGLGNANQVLSISPTDGRGQPLPSFVRMTGPSFGFDLQGYTGQGPLVTTLDSTLTYELLIVPDGPLAPMLVRGAGSPQFFDGRMIVLPGITVHGDAHDGAGRPVVGARVLMRADTRPSTLGVTAADGTFDLQTRDGTLSATIVPPDGSGLPEGHVSASPGIVLGLGVVSVELAMTWSASNASAPLDVVVSVGGVALAGARVRAETVAELPSVGELRAKRWSAKGLLDMFDPFLVTGSARAEVETDAQGVAHLGLLPIAKYHLTVAPPAGSSAAITAADVELHAPGASVPISLAARVKVAGRLLPASAGAGARITAVDSGVLAPLSPATAMADGLGNYELSLSPGRTYELIVEPAGAGRWRRVAFAKQTITANVPPRADTLPPNLPWWAIVTGAGRAVPGALVQVFCIAPPASCVDPTIPVADGMTQADGALTLTLPNLAP